MRRVTLLGICALAAPVVWGYAPENAAREARFADPPACTRILPIHHHRPDNDHARIDGELDLLQRQGFGGLTGNVSFGDDYLKSTNAWAALRYTVEQAGRRGLRMWLYDENGYPSGTAGGYVTDGHPEWTARGLLVAATNVPGGVSATLAVAPGRIRRACAFPLAEGRIDTAKGVEIPVEETAVAVAWTAPSGAVWKLMAISEGELYEGTHAAMNLSKKIPYVNLLMREPTAAFIRITHEAYARELGAGLGRAFDALFTDEPSLMSLWLRAQPWHPLPYCPDLPEDYATRVSPGARRDLLKDVPAIVFEAENGETPRLRHAFWNLVGERVSRNYMGQLDSWARAHGLAGGGHLLCEEWVTGHVPLYGDFFRCLRALGQPGTDMLTSIPGEVSWLTCQLGGSAGALNASRHVMCEVSDHCQRYRPAGDARPIRQVSVDEINGTLNRLVWGGTDTFTSYYCWTPFKNQEIRRINERVGRCVTLLTEGPNAAEVAVLYPADTLQAGCVPQAGVGGGTTPAAARANECLMGTGASLFTSGRSWMFADVPSLLEAKIEPGPVLAVKGLAWRVVVLPGVDTLPEAAIRKLHAFWKAGGTLVAVGAVPVNSTRAFPSEGMKAFAAEIFGAKAFRREFSVTENATGGRGVFLPQGQARLTARLLARLIAPSIDVRGVASGEKSALRVAHRRGGDGGDVFFVMNDEGTPWRGELRLCGGGAAELWDPAAGTHRPFAVDGEGFGGVELPAFGAVLFTTATRATPKRVTFSERGLRPKMGPPVAFRQEALSRGRWVDGTATAVDAEGWHRLDVTLTKSDVDTFAFVPFACAEKSFAGAEGVQFAFRVSKGRASGPTPGVFLEMADGSRRYATGAVSFAERGETVLFLPFDAFAVFGDAPKGGVRPFDPAQIVRVSVGFGGYFGSAGERVAVDFREARPVLP